MKSCRRAAVASVVFALVVALGWAAGRPTERVSPAPSVNDEAVVWRTPDPPTDPQAGDLWISPKDTGQMVYVPAGEFIMGSSDADIAALVQAEPAVQAQWFADEQPQFRSYLPGYWIDKYEVTVAQYRTFCEETGRHMPETPKAGWQDDHPIVNVTWDDAAAYARWAGKRVPTEREWEKAARGTDGRKYPWGDAWDAGKCANRSNSDGTQPVGRYPNGASPCGALDMAGNVWEWCADWYDKEAYERYAKGDLRAPESGRYKVLRGGHWGSASPRVFRCAARFDFPPGSYGFRCVRGAG